MQEWIVQLTNTYGYFGILLLIFLENVFPPIPSEVILPFSGFLTTCTNMNVLGVIIYSSLGSVLGAIVLYGVGYALNQERLEKILDGRIGKILHFKKDNVEKTMAWFRRYGIATVFFCRCIPMVRSLISIPAGMTKMEMGKFLSFTLLGSLIWNTALISLGAWAGSSWGMISGYIAMYSDIIKIVVGGILISFLMGYLFQKRKKQGMKQNS